MPCGDETGPTGAGCMSRRTSGACLRHGAAGEVRQQARAGLGRAWRRGRGGAAMSGAAADEASNSVEERPALCERVDTLTQEVEALKSRLAALEKGHAAGSERRCVLTTGSEQET